MPTIKTAISIDKSLYRRVETLAKKLSLSRSQVFSQAVEYLIDRDENLELVRKINLALENGGDNRESEVARRAGKKFSGIVKGSW